MRNTSIYSRMSVLLISLLFITGIEIQRDWSHYTRGGEKTPVQGLSLNLDYVFLILLNHTASFVLSLYFSL